MPPFTFTIGGLNPQPSTIQNYMSANGGPSGLREISVGRAIGSQFDCEPLHSDCHAELRKFVSIGREGENWRLVIRNRWELEVILDSKFSLISTRNLTQPPEGPQMLVPFRVR
jgi:hypothetical protein